MKVLGICSDVWISSAALIEDGKVIAAIPEERLNRQKQYRGFPKNAIEFCLKEANCKLEDIDYIAIGWNPGKHIKRYNGRFSSTMRWRGEYLYAIPNSLMMVSNDRDISYIEQQLHLKSSECKIVFIDHHSSHAGNGFFLSSFKEAAILTADGRGEDDTLTYAVGKDNKIEKLSSILFPHSIGLFYGTFTQFLGFTPDSDEWKVMALASYVPQDKKKNNPYYEKVKKLITFNENSGSFDVDLSYFSYYLHDQFNCYSEKFTHEFGKTRNKNDPLTEKDYQIAEALQRVVEETLLSCLKYLHKKTGMKNLVVNGGTFMNSVFNGKIISETEFENVFIGSCPDDSGTSIGAALYVYNMKADSPKRSPMIHNYYGPQFSNKEIKETLDKYKLNAEYIEEIEKHTAILISQGKLVGWFQGKMEFGQRALGNRSILADPRDPAMKDKVNLAVKYRESFRPFAPSILEEKTPDFFTIEKNTTVPFMEKVYMIKKEKQHLIPAVTHIDGSGRLQTVNKEINPKYHMLISHFKDITGIPIVLNTSFNLNGEAIVCTPTDAIRTFYSCGLDVLVLGNYIIRK